MVFVQNLFFGIVRELIFVFILSSVCVSFYSTISFAPNSIFFFTQVYISQID